LDSLRAAVAATLAFTSAGTADAATGTAAAINPANIIARIFASIRCRGMAYRRSGRFASSCPDLSTNGWELRAGD